MMESADDPDDLAEHMKPHQSMNVAEEEVAFFLEVGKALRQWAAVEGQMQEIVRACVHPIDAPTVIDGFLGIENFRSKLKFCDNLVRRRFKGSANLDEWEKLHNTIASKSAARNLLAHGRHIVDGNATPCRRVGIVSSTEEQPVLVSSKGRVTLVSDAVCLGSVITARDQFFALTCELVRVRLLLLGEPALPREFDAPPAAPPDLLSTRNQIRRALGIQPLPSPKKRQA